MNDVGKYKCANCGKTILIGNLSGGAFTMKCKSCGAINLIKVHPVIIIQEVPPGMMTVHKKVIGVSLPKIRQRIITIK